MLLLRNHCRHLGIDLRLVWLKLCCHVVVDKSLQAPEN